MADAKVREVLPDTYEVTDFVLSMPHLRFRVVLDNNKAHVISREGCNEDVWDRHAISAVQFALIMGTAAEQ